MKFRLSIIGLILLSSCDVPGVILIKNLTGGEVIYQYKLKTEHEIRTISIPGSGRSRQAGIIFNYGEFWTDQRIKQYASDLNFIHIITSDDTLKIEASQQMEKFFLKNRGGVLKSQITIKVTSDFSKL